MISRRHFMVASAASVALGVATPPVFALDRPKGKVVLTFFTEQ